MPPTELLRLRLLSLLVAAGSLVLLIWSAFTGATSPTIAAPAAAIPHTDVNPIGANFFLEREVEPWKREQTVRMAKEAGIGWIKMMFPWAEIEPRKGVYFDDKFKKSSWEKYDDIVGLAEKYGLRIIARLDHPPAWARPGADYANTPPASIADYADYVRAVVGRYRGRVQYYQIWNEPNIYPDWGERGPDPAGYTQMLKLAYQAAKQADPDAVILSAPLAETLEESARNLTELTYLDGMYRAGAAPYFDILSVNAYGLEYPPDAPPDPKVLNFSRVKLLREIMERHGDGNKPMWFNEFGWNASPPDFPPQRLVWRRVTEQQQADYTVQAIRMAREWGWVGVVNIWYFRQVGDISPQRSDYFFRLVDVDFTPRPVYLKLKELAEELRRAGPGVREETNAAVDAPGGWRGRRMEDASGGRVLVSPEGNGVVTFTIDGTGLSLYVVAGSPATLNVSVDGNNSSIDLPAGDGSSIVKTSVVSGLAPGVHTVRIEQAAGAPWAFDAFEVERTSRAPQVCGLLFGAMLGATGLAASFGIPWQRA